jgi:hypothetical protein
VKCPHCEREYTEHKDQRTCPHCGASLEPENIPPEIEIDDPEPPDQPNRLSKPSRKEYCPWEDQEKLGFVESMIQTVRQSVFSPELFFSILPKGGGFLQPLLYAISLEMLGTLVGLLWSMALGGKAFAQFIAMFGGSAVGLALLIPVFVFLGTVLWSFALHASLFLMGGANEDFEATFRIVCYSSGVVIFNLVPIFGGFIKGAWQLYITMIGLREVHGVTTGRAVGAIIIPFLFCFALPMVGVMAVMMTSH